MVGITATVNKIIFTDILRCGLDAKVVSRSRSGLKYDFIVDRTALALLEYKFYLDMIEGRIPKGFKDEYFEIERIEGFGEEMWNPVKMFELVETDVFKRTK